MTQFKELDAQEQAALFANRERTRLKRGYQLDIPRTHRVVGASSLATTIPVDSLQGRDRICTFKTRVRHTSGEANGNIFAFGNGTQAVTMYMEAGVPVFQAGGASSGVDMSNVTGPTALASAEDWELTLIGMVRADGLVGLWIPDINYIDWESDGTFTGDTWAANAAGTFAQAATIPVGISTAPSNFEVVEPLSIYYGSLPRVGIPA